MADANPGEGRLFENGLVMGAGRLSPLLSHSHQYLSPFSKRSLAHLLSSCSPCSWPHENQMWLSLHMCGKPLWPFSQQDSRRHSWVGSENGSTPLPVHPSPTLVRPLPPMLTRSHLKWQPHFNNQKGKWNKSYWIFGCFCFCFTLLQLHHLREVRNLCLTTSVLLPHTVLEQRCRLAAFPSDRVFQSKASFFFCFRY